MSDDLKPVIEALIFASPDPLTPKMLFKLLEQVGMRQQADRPCSVLAYGDVKRVELARLIDHSVLKPEATEREIREGAQIQALESALGTELFDRAVLLARDAPPTCVRIAGAWGSKSAASARSSGRSPRSTTSASR